MLLYSIYETTVGHSKCDSSRVTSPSKLFFFCEVRTVPHCQTKATVILTALRSVLRIVPVKLLWTARLFKVRTTITMASSCLSAPSLAVNRCLVRKALFAPSRLCKNDSNRFYSSMTVSWHHPSRHPLPATSIATSSSTSRSPSLCRSSSQTSISFSTFSLSSRLSTAPLRLRRPLRFTDPETLQNNKNPPHLRPHAITLFPGDFRDDEDDDDDDNNEYGGDGEEYDDITDRMVRELRRREQKQQQQRERWLQNNIPPERHPVIDVRGRAYGRGGRKRAQARVWIQAGLGQVVVNQKPLDDYFVRLSDRALILQPLVATETCGKWDVTAMVQGGGLTGQAGAIRHGLSNALNAYDPHRYRPILKPLGFLTRDARKVERKKIGHTKARKSPQWVRR